MAHLALSFLGGFQAALDGRPLTRFKSNKVRALLAYLAVEGDRPHRREALAGLLWPDRTNRDALSNLRCSLARLRTTLGDRTAAVPFLLVSHDTIQFNQASDHWLDVAQFERQGGSAHARRRASSDDLVAAIGLYRGSFLEGFSVDGAAPFEEWALLRREQIGQQVIAALSSLVAALEAQSDFQEAQAYARQQVALEPWSEEAHRALMRALALDNQRNAALHQFQTCRQILRDELGVEPAEETVALYEAIREGDWEDKETSEQADQGIGRYEPSSHLPVASAGKVVAREDQLDRLQSSLAAALDGTGHVMFVIGEAGSGKTALLGEFARRAMRAHTRLLVACGACNAIAGIGDPYLPFREILQLLTGDIERKRAGAALAPEHARRLWAAMPDAMQALATEGPDLLDTLVPAAGLALRAEALARQPGRSDWHARVAQSLRPAHGGARIVRQSLQLTDIFDQVAHVLQALAARHPLLLILDDLQWADSGSISLLFHLGRRIAASRILLVGAYRPDAIAAPSGEERHSIGLVTNELLRISGQKLIDLDACPGRPFVEALLDTEPNRLDAGFREQLLGHTEGQPLFTVELLRGMEERGDLVRDAEGSWIEGPALHWDRLPARVEAAIAEHIGRLPNHCKPLLAAASVEGEEFTAEVVARALAEKEATVVRCLSSDLGERHRLVTAVSLRRLGGHKISRYRFRHNLFQRYLCDHLDPVTRASLHEAVGSALEALYEGAPDELETLASRLAWHFEGAGLADRAATHHLQAGKRATRLAAHEEAIAHLTRGLALMDTLTDTPERVGLRLELQLAVVFAASFARGFWSPERNQALERVRQISRHPALAASSRSWTALAALAYFAMWSAEPAQMLSMGGQLLHQAERNQDPQQLQWAHCTVGCAQLLSGRFILAREHLDQVVGLPDHGYDPMQDLPIGIDARIMALTWQSFAVWQLGYPDQSLQHLQEALLAAEESGYVVSLAHSRHLASIVFSLCARDPAAAGQQREALRESSEIIWPYQALVDSLAGPEFEEATHDEQVLHQMRQGLARFQTTGSGLGRAGQLLLLARGYVHAGQVEAAVETVEETLTWISATGMRCFEAEAKRLLGEFLLMGQNPQEDAVRLAEARFREAIAVARQQEARWWELRATVSLCRLLKEKSTSNDARLAEAHQMLAALYGWFSEGFDTLDLREARELLEALEQDAAPTP